MGLKYRSLSLTDTPSRPLVYAPGTLWAHTDPREEIRARVMWKDNVYYLNSSKCNIASRWGPLSRINSPLLPITATLTLYRLKQVARSTGSEISDADVTEGKGFPTSEGV